MRSSAARASSTAVAARQGDPSVVAVIVRPVPTKGGVGLHRALSLLRQGLEMVATLTLRQARGQSLRCRPPGLPGRAAPLAPWARSPAE